MNQSDKTSARLDWILRCLAAVGLGASALLWWEYAQETSMFCGRGEGCDAVRLSAYASLLGVPTPVYGVLFFAAVLVLSLVPGPVVRGALTLVAAVGGLGGVGFILLQTLEVHAFCKYCLIVDVASILIALLALANRAPTPALDPRGWLAFALLLLVGFGAPFAYGRVTHPAPRDGAPTAGGPPACVLRDQAPAGATIVAFVDFACPYCQAEHFLLRQMLEDLPARLGKPVRFVRRHFPLPGHKDSKEAARAAICAEEAGRGEMMADLLFSAEDHSPAMLETYASQLGMDLGAFRSCLGSATTFRRLEDDVACGNVAGIDGLPTVFIGAERLEGMQKEEILAGAIRRAAAAKP
jgi:predicted DsbA family dithiol-disulfide isomerase/uncharacterized membrane protein